MLCLQPHFRVANSRIPARLWTDWRWNIDDALPTCVMHETPGSASFLKNSARRVSNHPQKVSHAQWFHAKQSATSRATHLFFPFSSKLECAGMEDTYPSPARQFCWSIRWNCTPSIHPTSWAQGTSTGRKAILAFFNADFPWSVVLCCAVWSMEPIELVRLHLLRQRLRSCLTMTPFPDYRTDRWSNAVRALGKNGLNQNWLLTKWLLTKDCVEKCQGCACKDMI